jgi:hypothetical protein
MASSPSPTEKSNDPSVFQTFNLALPLLFALRIAHAADTVVYVLCLSD